MSVVPFDRVETRRAGGEFRCFGLGWVAFANHHPYFRVLAADVFDYIYPDSEAFAGIQQNLLVLDGKYLAASRFHDLALKEVLGKFLLSGFIRNSLQLIEDL